MNPEAKLLWGGFAAAVIGSIQVDSIIIRVASAGWLPHGHTWIATHVLLLAAGYRNLDSD